MAATPNATRVKKINPYIKLSSSAKGADVRVNPLVFKFANLVNKQGGLAFLVGGSVRDLLLGNKVQDFDIEVHHLKASKVKAAAKKFGGKVVDAGKSFGVLKIIKGKIQIDVSLPRRDSKTGPGHKDFSVNTDAYMGIREALRRRDFTINAIALNPLTGEIFDPFNGIKDLMDKKLNVVDAKTFSEDPLRVLRGMQLASRFELQGTPSSKTVLAKTVPGIRHLSRERIWGEWKKLLLSNKPSCGLELGMRIGYYKKYHPELEILPDTLQNLDWHPERDVWSHTKFTADLGADIAKREKLDENSTLILVLAAIAHDLGKPAATKIINGVIRSLGHAKAGVEPAKKFLKRIGAPKSLWHPVVGLVLNHMRPLTIFFDKKKISRKGLNKLARDLAEYGTNIHFLNYLNQADFFGVGSNISKKKAEELKKFKVYTRRFLQKALTANVAKNKPADILRGRDLLKLGLTPGPELGKLIHEANRLHEEKGYNKNKILKLLKEHYA